MLLSLCVLLLAACGGQAVYKEENFASDSPFRLRSDGEVTLACESARRALLGQGYLIESATGEGVKGRKAYRNEDAKNAYIEMNVVCLPEPGGSTLFANGLLSAYELKKSASSASVGVSALGSISLPIGQSADSLVKVSEETINDAEFYRRFFAAIRIIMDEMQENWEPPGAEPSREAADESIPDAAPEPAPKAVLEPAIEAAPEPALDPVLEVATPAPVPPLTPVEPVAPTSVEPPSVQPESAVSLESEPQQEDPEPVQLNPEPVQVEGEAAPVPQAGPESDSPAPVGAEAAGEAQPAPAQGVPEAGPDSLPDPVHDIF